jgi:FkbM family methyltransferase
MRDVKNVVITVLDHLLPDCLKQSLVHLSFHLAPAEFHRFAYLYSFAPNMALGLEEMKKRGFYPRTIIDVGAFAGEWSIMARRLWPTSQLFMIEPNQSGPMGLADVAKDIGASVFNEILGATDHRTIRFTVMGSGSSVLAERSSVPRHVQERSLRRLDSLLTTIDAPALLKIDAQGYELEILKGATELLSAIDAILLEISIIEINEGAPLLHDVLSFMKALGFVAYDIFEIHRRPLDRALNQVDIIFIREHSALIADKRHFA